MLANVTMRAGARLRYADERLRVALNGQQLAPSNLTFRYYAAPRPTLLRPSGGPAAGGTPLTVSAENLAEASGFECAFASGNSLSSSSSSRGGGSGGGGDGDGDNAGDRGSDDAGSGDAGSGDLDGSDAGSGDGDAIPAATATATGVHTPAELLSSVTTNNNDTDGAAGIGRVRCLTPASSVALGEWDVGLRVHRDDQAYSTHDEVAAVPLPFWVYPPLPPSTGYAPLGGPGAGGTLVRIALPQATDPHIASLAALSNVSDGDAVETVAGLWPRHGASCRFDASAYGDAYGAAVVEASHDAEAGAGRAMLCVTPPLPGGEAPLQLALNGHDFEPLAALPFGIYGRPRLLEAVPAGATTGTAILLVGDNFDGGGVSGVNHTCRFQGENNYSVVVPGELLSAPRVVANRWRPNTVRCVVPVGPPPGSDTDRSVWLRLSLNGQQYTPERVGFAFAWSSPWSHWSPHIPYGVWHI